MNREFDINTPQKTAQRSPANPLVVGIIYFILTLYLPIALFADISSEILGAISIAAAAFAVIGLYSIIKSARPVVSFAMTFGIILIFLSSIVCGIAAAFIGSVYLLSYLLISSKKTSGRFFALAVSPVSYLLCAALLGSFTTALIAIIHLPAALVLTYCFSRKIDRISTICRTSCAILLSFGALFAAAFFMAHGTDLEALRALIESVRTSATDFLANTLYTVYSQIPEMSMSMTDALEFSTTAVNTVFNLLPAIVIISSNIVAFFLQSTMTTILIQGETDKEKIHHMVAFDMSLISAIVFLAAFLVTAILSEKMSVWSVTAENIAMILIPGLAFTALIALRQLIFSKKPSCFGALTYLLSIIVLFYIPAVMLSLYAFAGAVVIILNNIAKHKLKKKN